MTLASRCTYRKKRRLLFVYDAVVSKALIKGNATKTASKEAPAQTSDFRGQLAARSRETPRDRRPRVEQATWMSTDSCPNPKKTLVRILKKQSRGQKCN